MNPEVGVIRRIGAWIRPRDILKIHGEKPMRVRVTDGRKADENKGIRCTL